MIFIAPCCCVWREDRQCGTMSRTQLYFSPQSQALLGWLRVTRVQILTVTASTATHTHESQVHYKFIIRRCSLLSEVFCSLFLLSEDFCCLMGPGSPKIMKAVSASPCTDGMCWRVRSVLRACSVLHPGGSQSDRPWLGSLRTLCHSWVQWSGEHCVNNPTVEQQSCPCLCPAHIYCRWCGIIPSMDPHEDRFGFYREMLWPWLAGGWSEKKTSPEWQKLLCIVHSHPLCNCCATCFFTWLVSAGFSLVKTRQHYYK